MTPCGLCARPIPDKYLATAGSWQGTPVHPGCLRKLQGKAPR